MQYSDKHLIHSDVTLYSPNHPPHSPDSSLPLTDLCLQSHSPHLG